MMSSSKIPVLLLALVLQGCAAWKSDLRGDGDHKIAVRNAVWDFSNTTSLVKDDTTFLVTVDSTENEIIAISISGFINKFNIAADREVDYSTIFPTRYLEYNNRLFFWYDESVPLGEEILNKLDEYNQIDSLEHFGYAELRIDDASNGMQYYFCKNNLLKYKKVKTNLALGSYDPPEVNCK